MLNKDYKRLSTRQKLVQAMAEVEVMEIEKDSSAYEKCSRIKQLKKDVQQKVLELLDLKRIKKTPTV